MSESWTQCWGSQEDIRWADKDIPHPGRAETWWSDLYLSPHMGSLLSFVIKGLVLRPRQIERAKHAFGAPSSGGDHASSALLPLHPLLSFLTLHLLLAPSLLSLFVLPVPCLKSQAHPALEHHCSMHRRCQRGFFLFPLQLKKRNNKFCYPLNN